VREADASSRATGGNYYLTHRQELTDAFQATTKGAVQLLEPEIGAERARTITQEALVVFDRLLPEFPDVGGERNWCTQFIPVAGWYVALYLPMRAAGRTAEDVGKLIYDLNVIKFRTMPREKAAEEGEKVFRPDTLDRFRDWAAWTRKREHPGNWVAYFVPGDGREFDYGYDYTECGVVKYFRAQGIPELSPYFCLNDLPRSAAYGSGLRRTKTIGQGDDLCNFRYKKGRPVLQDWSTEIDLIRSRAPR
jgi:hypothetical protein